MVQFLIFKCFSVQSSSKFIAFKMYSPFEAHTLFFTVFFFFFKFQHYQNIFPLLETTGPDSWGEVLSPPLMLASESKLNASLPGPTGGRGHRYFLGSGLSLPPGGYSVYFRHLSLQPGPLMRMGRLDPSPLLLCPLFLLKAQDQEKGGGCEGGA